MLAETPKPPVSAEATWERATATAALIAAFDEADGADRVALLDFLGEERLPDYPRCRVPALIRSPAHESCCHQCGQHAQGG